jgi:hypothetical protein
MELKVLCPNQLQLLTETDRRKLIEVEDNDMERMTDLHQDRGGTMKRTDEERRHVRFQ